MGHTSKKPYVKAKKDKHFNGYTFSGKWAISENSSVDSKTTSVKWQAGQTHFQRLHFLVKLLIICCVQQK
jgi:hypothetical protein